MILYRCSDVVAILSDLVVIMVFDFSVMDSNHTLFLVVGYNIKIKSNNTKYKITLKKQKKGRKKIKYQYESVNAKSVNTRDAKP